MRRLLTLFGVLGTVVLATYVAFAAISIPTTPAYTQTFDSIGTAATATLPADFRVDRPSTVRTVGTFAAAQTATTQVGGNNLSASASNGVYNFGAGAPTTATDRAIGFLSSGTATASGNLYAQLVNNTAGDFSGLKISYNVEKYRQGINAAGFRIQMFYSTDGATWANAGANFQTAFPQDPGTVNSGYASAPGVTVPVSNQTLSVVIPSGANFYLACNYSVTTGTVTTNGQALAVDDIVIQGIPAGPTNPTGSGSAAPGTVQAGTSTTLTVAVTPGANPTSTGIAVSADLSSIGGSANQAFADKGNNSFSFTAGVPAATAAGPKTIPVTIADDLARSSTASIALTVTPASTPPTGTGSASPGSVHAGEVTDLSVTVAQGTNPTSPVTSVVADLSSIDGSPAQAFTFVSGTTWTYHATVGVSTTPGARSLPFTVSDSATPPRSSSSAIPLTILPPPPPTTVKISQVYAGGGNSGATYTNDFIEIFNEDVNPVDVTGWSVQYNSAGSTTGNWQMTPICPVGPCVILPGHYFLVEEAAGNSGTTALPVPNAVGAINMGASSGKVALMNFAVAISGQCPAGGTFVDLVGYGSANCSEGSPAPGLGNTAAAIRRGNGCQDTDVNAGDFVSTGPIPRNSLAPANSCVVDPSMPSGLGIAVPDSIDPDTHTLLTVHVAPATAPPSTGVTVTANLAVLGGSASQAFYDDGTHGDLAAGDGTFSFDQHVSPATLTGVKYITGVIADEQGRTATAPITVTVQSPTCGVERWMVKVGSDATVGLVRLDIPPTPATILELGTVTPPDAATIDTTPVAGPWAFARDTADAGPGAGTPVETTVYVVDATLTFYKKETDVDYHLVLNDNAVPTPHTLIAEIPSPACILADGQPRTFVASPLGPGISAARAAFDARLSATSFFQTANIPVRVKGVGFFDFEHGQTGVAPNAIELHPVLEIFFRANTTPTLLPSGTPVYGHPLTFTATVTSGGDHTPTGDVSFFDSATGSSLSATLDSAGQASFSSTTLAAGPHAIIASYPGDDHSVASASAPLTFDVARADQSIDFAALPDRVYGAAPFTVSAGGGASGNPVTFAVSGTCERIADTIAITGAGSCSVTASQAGNANYNAAADVTRTFAVAPKAMSTSANDAAREFGAPNPPLTGTLTGVVGGDGITALYTTAAGPTSPVGGYPIVPVLNDPNGRLGNYVVTAHNGVLTVVDTTPPAIAGVKPSVDAIWPPNKQMIGVTLTVAVSDAADATPVCTVTGVSSNEPEPGDSAITGSLTVSLRADRNGNGAGRVYTIAVRCVDASGNASSATATVSVPHDQRQ